MKVVPTSWRGRAPLLSRRSGTAWHSRQTKPARVLLGGDAYVTVSVLAYPSSFGPGPLMRVQTLRQKARIRR